MRNPLDQWEHFQSRLVLVVLLSTTNTISITWKGKCEFFLTIFSLLQFFCKHCVRIVAKISIQLQNAIYYLNGRIISTIKFSRTLTNHLEFEKICQFIIFKLKWFLMTYMRSTTRWNWCLFSLLSHDEHTNYPSYKEDRACNQWCNPTSLICTEKTRITITTNILGYSVLIDVTQKCHQATRLQLHQHLCLR